MSTLPFPGGTKRGGSWEGEAGTEPVLSGVLLSVTSFFEFLSEKFFNTAWHQPFHCTAEAGNLFDDAGTEIGMFRTCHKKDGFHILIQPSVHQRHLKFIFKVGYSAQSFNNHGRLAFKSVVYQQAFKTVNTHFRPFSAHFLQHCDALV